MATIEANVVHKNSDNQPLGYRLVTWNNITEADSGGAVFLRPNNNDRTVQVTGTFGGATITLQGSLDGTNFFTLTDPAGADLAFTAAGGSYVVENCPYYRVIEDSGSSTDVDVTLLAVGV